MIKQLTLFEEKYFLPFEPIKHWKFETEIIEHIDLRYKINRRSEIIDCEKNKQLKPINAKGYAQINLKVNKKWKTFRVHRLVACTFLENNNKLKLTEVDHIDENKLNNEIINLQWSTRSDNAKKKIHTKQFKMF